MQEEEGDDIDQVLITSTLVSVGLVMQLQA